MAGVDLTPSPLLSFRQALATAITTATGLECHADLLPVVGTPSVVIRPDGWTAGTAVRQVYGVRVLVLYTDGVGTAVPSVEELARQVFVALRAAGYTVGDVPPPAPFTFGDGETARTFLAVEFTAADYIDLSEENT